MPAPQRSVRAKMARPAAPIVHLELRTPNPPRALNLYTRLFGWRAETVHAGEGTYLALELGETVQGGVSEVEAGEAGWLPYVEVEEIGVALERARMLGAAVVLDPREGPAGWWARIAVPEGAEIALWQPKP